MAKVQPGAQVGGTDYCAPCFKGLPGREQAWLDHKVRALTGVQGWTKRSRRTCGECGERFLARTI